MRVPVGKMAFGLMAWAAVAVAQPYRTPVRASWTEDPATTATLTWDTAEDARGTVSYGLTTNFTAVQHDGGGLRHHVIPLRELQPGTRYYYEASSTDGFRQPGSFMTARARGEPLHFVLHGDLNGGLDVAWGQSVASRIQLEDPDWVVQLGDLSDERYGGAGFATWTNFFQICSNELARTVFMPIFGNHDDPGPTNMPDQASGLFHRLFALPEPALGNGYYAYTVGSIRFICLNTENGTETQTNWLARELQAAANDTNIVWTIPVFHRPPYSQGEREGWVEARTNWSPLFVKYEVDWVFSGHSHNYQRTVPIRGVRYLVSGGGGAWPYDAAYGEPMLSFTTTCFHHVSCNVTGSVMQIRAVRSDGLVFDSETVTNRRQVRVEPAFPLRGQTTTVRYRPAGGPLAAASPVYLYLGQDAFTNAWLDTPMTWNAAQGAWEYSFTVPATAMSRLAFVFHDAAGTTWHNNYTNNWQALLGRASVSPAPPVAGSNVTIRYEADMGPLAGATQVQAWVSFNDGHFPTTDGVAMTHVSGARWECTVPVPAWARNLSLKFISDSASDDEDRRGFVFAVAGATNAAWPPAPVAAAGSPVVTDNPAGTEPNNIGDNFDLAVTGPALVAQDALPGFGDWGCVRVNADATNLYLGGTNVDLGGSNNVLILFVGLDTLSDNAWNLWHKSGPPAALDYLHNVRFTEPMDLALVLGDGYGDGPDYTNFTYGGTDFGQGIYYIGTNSADFVPVPGARLSQFDGTGTVACATGGDDAHRRMSRWEAAIPWNVLGAAGPQSASNLFLCGVIASDGTNGSDRYLSRTCVGEWGWGDTDEYGQHGFRTESLWPLRVNFLHADLLGDGISNGWRQAWFGSPAGPGSDADSDGDGQDNAAEELAGTSPADGNSMFAVAAPALGSPFVMQWTFAAGRAYDVYFTTNLLLPFQPLVTGLATNRYVPNSNGYYRVRVRR